MNLHVNQNQSQLLIVNYGYNKNHVVPNSSVEPYLSYGYESLRAGSDSALLFHFKPFPNHFYSVLNFLLCLPEENLPIYIKPCHE